VYSNNVTEIKQNEVFQALLSVVGVYNGNLKVGPRHSSDGKTGKLRSDWGRTT
jgi:hypothetical protein